MLKTFVKTFTHGYLALLLIGCSTDDPKQYISEGKTLFDKGELESARVQFQNALQLDPKLGEAYFQMALLDEKKQNWAGMLNNLKETVTVDPKHLQAQIKLGQFYLVGGQLDKAAECAQMALASNQQEIKALLLLASVQFRRGLHEEAMQRVESVLAKQPFLPEAVGLKASILATQGKAAEALSVVSVGIEHNPAERNLHLLKIRLEIDSKNFDQAVHDYQALIALYPDDAGLYDALADLFSDIGRLQDAETILSQVIAKSPTNTWRKLKLVAWVGQRNAEQAEQLLKKFLAEMPKDTELKFGLAEYYIAHRQLQDAEAVLQGIVGSIEASSDHVIAKIKLAQVALLQQNRERVLQLAEEVLAVDSAQNDALLLRAGMRLNKGDVDGSIADLRIVLRDRPDSEQSLLLLAQASMLKGEIEVAESQWRKVLEINPHNMAAIVPLANQLLKRGDYAGAEDIVAKAAPTARDATAAMELLIQIKAAKKDWSGAHLVLDKLSGLPDATPVAKYWAAFLAARQGRIQQALGNYREALERQPRYRQALVDLCQLYESTGQKAELLVYLADFTAKNPGSLLGVELLAAAHAAENNWEAAEKSLLKAEEIDPANIGLRLKRVDVVEKISDSRAEALLKEWVISQPDEVMYKMRLTDFYTKRKRYPEAKSLLLEVADADAAGKRALSAKLKLAELALLQHDTGVALSRLNEVLNLYPDHQYSLMLLAQTYVAQKDFSNAGDTYERILKIYPANGEAANNLADLIASYRSEDRESMARASALVERFKNSPHAALQDTYGWVRLKSDDTAHAIPALQRAKAGLPKDPRVHYHLAEAYNRNGDSRAAIAELQQALSLAEEGEDFIEIPAAKVLLERLQTR